MDESMRSLWALSWVTWSFAIMSSSFFLLEEKKLCL